MYKGIENLGVSISYLVNVTQVLFSSFLAILFLGENLTLTIVAVTMLSILGVIILSTSSTDHSKIVNTRVEKKKYIFPILSALFYSISSIFRKIGVDIVTSSVGGATVAVTSSWVLLVIIFVSLRKKQKIIVDKKALVFFYVGAILVGLGQIFMMNSLQLGEIVAIIPLHTTATPFFTLFLLFFFKKFRKNKFKSYSRGKFYYYWCSVIKNIFLMCISDEMRT